MGRQTLGYVDQVRLDAVEVIGIFFIRLLAADKTSMNAD